jgi:hypothetical protein
MRVACDFRVKVPEMVSGKENGACGIYELGGGRENVNETGG